LVALDVNYIDQAINELICQFGVKESISSASLYDALTAGKPQECITKIAHYLGLPVVIDLSTVELESNKQFGNMGEKFESTSIVVSPANAGQPAQSITAQVMIPHNLPMYGTSALQGFHLRIKVSKNCQNYPKTFAAVMGHELSHVVLYSIMHNQRHNEYYTDLTAMILGFSEVFQLGRKVVETKQSAKTITITTTTYGYLSDAFFDFAFNRIQRALNEFKRAEKDLQKKILQGSDLYKNLLVTYHDKCELLSKLLENFDRTPQKIGKDDASRMVEMHQLYFLDGLKDNYKKHLSRQSDFSKSLNKVLSVTLLYSKQGLNYLQVFSQKIENAVLEIQKDVTSMESDISLLEKNTGFFAKRRINHQMQREAKPV
jgi:hypothetical protein